MKTQCIYHTLLTKTVTYFITSMNIFLNINTVIAAATFQDRNTAYTATIHVALLK
jgi:hypothetical protein